MESFHWPINLAYSFKRIKRKKKKKKNKDNFWCWLEEHSSTVEALTRTTHQQVHDVLGPGWGRRGTGQQGNGCVCRPRRACSPMLAQLTQRKTQAWVRAGEEKKTLHLSV